MEQKIIRWSILTFETYQKGKVHVGNKCTDLKNFPKLTNPQVQKFRIERLEPDI